MIQTKEFFEPKLGPGTCWVPLSAHAYAVNKLSAMLTIIPEERRLAGVRWDAAGEDFISLIRGVVRRVRVIEVKRGHKKCRMLFYGRSDLARALYV
jgi:hypothetical protein